MAKTVTSNASKNNGFFTTASLHECCTTVIHEMHSDNPPSCPTSACVSARSFHRCRIALTQVAPDPEGCRLPRSPPIADCVERGPEEGILRVWVDEQLELSATE